MEKMCDQEEMKENSAADDQKNSGEMNENNQSVLPSEKFLEQLDSVFRSLKDKRVQDVENQQQFRIKLLNWAEECSNGITTNTNAITKSKADIVNKKLEEVWATIQRVQKLEKELMEYKSKIGMVYQVANVIELPE